MTDSSGYSMKSMESESKLSQSHKNNSIFSRIYNLLKNGLLNELEDERKHAKIKNYNSKKKLVKDKVARANKVTKSPKTKTIKPMNKKLAKVLQGNKRVTELRNNLRQFNIPDKPPVPVLGSLKLNIADTPKPVRSTAPHKVTYEGKNNKPQIIQLGSRKAIRIDPNSSTSTISLSPPVIPVSHSTVQVSESAVPESPPAVSISPPNIPPSQPVVPMSPPTVPLSPPTVSLSPPSVQVSLPAFPPPQPGLLFYETIHGNQPTPQNIATSNTSTPFKSRSRMIRVNTIEDLNEPQNNKRPIAESNSSSLQGNSNELLGYARIKDKKKKKKMFKKREKKRNLLQEEDKRTARLDESDNKAVLTENGVNSLRSASEAISNFNINNIYNPFITNTHRENVSPTMISTGDNIQYIPKISETNKDPSDLTPNSGIVFGTSKKSTNDMSMENSVSHKNMSGNHFVTNLNVVPKEDGDISKLFMSSDIDSEHDRGILEYRSKSREYSELKWPGHDSIGEIVIKNELTTPHIRQYNRVDSSKETNINKPRLLSEIMAEKYRKDGISFMGKFKTPHISATAGYHSSDESGSIAEQKQESPVYKKFGIDIRKERFRGEGRQDNNSNVH